MSLPALYNAILFFQLSFMAILLVVISWRLRTKGFHRYAWSSSLLSGFSLLFIAFATQLVVPVPYPYVGYEAWWSGAWFIITLVHAVRVHRKKVNERSKGGCGETGKFSHAPTKDPGVSKTRPAPGNFTNDQQEPRGETTPVLRESKMDGGNDGLMSRHEFLRKLFHLAGLLLFFSFYLVGPIAAELVRMAILSSEPAYVPLWGSLDLVHVFAGARDAGKQLTLFALLCTVSITCIVDLPRLFLGDDYSIVNLIEKQAGRILREKERGAPGPQVFISISATAAWITCLMLDGNVPLAMEIGVATGLVSTLSDGVAAIVGKYFGKHKVIRGDDVKSIEGFISGAGSAFFIALPFVGPVLASIAAGIFLLVDVLSPAVADNVINPLLIAPALLLVASFL